MAMFWVALEAQQHRFFLSCQIEGIAQGGARNWKIHVRGEYSSEQLKIPGSRGLASMFRITELADVMIVDPCLG
jgi:hypothetical protein